MSRTRRHPRLPPSGASASGARRAGLGALLGLLLLVSACGYRSVAPLDPAERPRVALRTLGNGSSLPGAELWVTEALRREILARGGLELVSRPDAADWVIAGRVEPIDLRAVSFSSVVLALEYRLTLRLDLEVEGPEGRSIRLDPTILSASELVLASADLEVTRKNRQEAIRKVAGTIAGRVHDVLFMEIAP